MTVARQRPLSGRPPAIRRLLALVDAPGRRLALAAALGTATICFGSGLMATSGYLISRAAEAPPVLALTTAIVGVRFFGIGRPAVRYLDRLAAHDLALRALGRVRVGFYRRIEPLAPAQLAPYRRGDLLSRMVADVDSLQDLHLRGILPPLVALATAALAVGATAAFLPAAALVLAAGLAVGGLAVPALARWRGRTALARQAEARARLTASLVEALESAPELAVYGRTDDVVAEVGRCDATLRRLARREALVGGLAAGLELLVAGITVAGVLAVAVAATDQGALDRVLVAMLALLATSSFEAIAPLPAAALALVSAAAAGRRLLELTDVAPRVSDPADPLPAPTGVPVVALEGVAARYAPDQPLAVDGVDLVLAPGRRVALVGEVGAGKTTVCNLLLRFLDPERGRVTLAGADLRRYAQADVRRAIAVAGQDSYLFSTSIRENVRIGRPTATDEEIADALRLAGLEAWVESLPDGCDTLVGDQGLQVSGGQRQRIAVARALLAEAPVLVLDEPTAHLDPPAAEALVRDVLAAAGERSVLLITHRPEGLELVDEIVALA